MHFIHGEQLSYDTRKRIRAAANAQGTPYPIVVYGDEVRETHPPRVVGEPGATHFLPHGRRGTRYMKYTKSTRHIVVGLAWLRERGIDVAAEVVLAAMRK